MALNYLGFYSNIWPWGFGFGQLDLGFRLCGLGPTFPMFASDCWTSRSKLISRSTTTYSEQPIRQLYNSSKATPVPVTEKPIGRGDWPIGRRQKGGTYKPKRCKNKDNVDP